MTILDFICLYFTSFLLFYGYSQTRKKHWTGSSKMLDLASKCLLLCTRNELSSSIYRSVAKTLPSLFKNAPTADQCIRANNKKKTTLRNVKFYEYQHLIFYCLSHTERRTSCPDFTVIVLSSGQSLAVWKKTPLKYITCMVIHNSPNFVFLAKLQYILHSVYLIFTLLYIYTAYYDINLIQISFRIYVLITTSVWILKCYCIYKLH